MSNKWQGTPVPNSGYVEKIYFNTNLSVDEVVAIIKKANLDYNSDFGINMYPVLTDGISEMVLIVPTDNGYKFGNEVVGGVYFNSDTGGWKENFNGEIQINGNLMTEAQGMTLGTQNDKLSSLFSITPFVKAEDKPKYDWLRELFINEAKAVLPKCTCNGGSSDDVTYEETENEAGGITVTIGSKEE